MVQAVKNLSRGLKQTVKQRNMLFELAKNDFRSRFLGSTLGIVWAFVQPIVMILVMWFVFQVGFKSMPVENFPFILWLISGFIPWIFISESVNSTANSISENHFLVKKVVFRVGMLPVVKIMSALFIHVFFIGFLIAMFMIYGYTPHMYYLQVLYYVFAACFFILGLSLITASLNVFIKDVSQIIGVALQILLWATPILWTMKMIPEKYQMYFKLNPFYYIVEGFRDSFIYKTWFWEHPALTLYFWGISITIFIIGLLVFKRLRPHFSDVL